MLHMHACADSKCVHIHCKHCEVALLGRFVGDSYILYILHVLPWQINVNNVAFAIHSTTVFTFHVCCGLQYHGNNQSTVRESLPSA